MNDVLDYVVYFVGSGLAYFSGTATILAGLALSVFPLGRAASALRNLMVLLGGLFVAISAAPLPWWLYALSAGLTLLWLPLEWSKARVRPVMVRGARFAVLAVWLLALAWEAPYHITPELRPLGHPTLLLIGDSVSAGMAEADKGTWPNRFARQHAVEVIDCSQAGATVKSARKQAQRLGQRPGLVLLEIGGNDLLGATTAEQYEEQLHALLAEVCRPERTVVMLGLPLPPLANRFGLIQRRLAREYDVILLPQRHFVGILTAPGATVDGIHLTPDGHQRMADTMWALLASAYD